MSFDLSTTELGPVNVLTIYPTAEDYVQAFGAEPLCNATAPAFSGPEDAAHACTVVPASDELPPRHPLDVVRFTGLLAALRACLHYRRDSRAVTYSGASWNPEQVFPFVVELDINVASRDAIEPTEDDWFRLTFASPSEVDPRTPAGLPIIRALLHRVMCHEADESLVTADERPFDPHAGVTAESPPTCEGTCHEDY